MRRTGRCEATAGCTRRSATCSRGTAPSRPTPCSRRTRARSTSSRTWPRARAACRTTPTAGPSSKSARGTAVVQHNGGNGIYVAEFVRFPDEDAMLFLTSTDTTLTATPVVEVLERLLFGGKAVASAARRRRGAGARAGPGGRVAAAAGRHAHAGRRWIGAGGDARGPGGVLGPRVGAAGPGGTAGRPLQAHGGDRGEVVCRRRDRACTRPWAAA